MRNISFFGVGLFFIFVNLFLSISVWANKDVKVYIIYRDEHGMMMKSAKDLKNFLKFGHVGFLFIYRDGSYKIIDCVPHKGVRETDLKGFDGGEGRNWWVFDLNLKPTQTAELKKWLDVLVDKNTSYAGIGHPDFHFRQGKGPNAYNCVGLVEATLENLRPKIDLTPEKMERFGLLPFEQLWYASKKLKRVEFKDLKNLN